MKKRIDFMLNIIESVVCILAILVFTVAGVEIQSFQRFFFVILDFYCAIRLTNCIDLVFGYIKSNRIIKYSEKNLDAQILNAVSYWH